MKLNLNDKSKVIISIILIAFAILVSCNTNSNPIPLFERIFKPISFGSVTFYYAGILIIILIYNCVRVIGNYYSGRFCNLFKHPLIMTILIIMVSFNTITPYITKTVKCFSNGLNSIYCDRETKGLNFNSKNENKVKITATMTLKNYSNEERKFYLKIYIPEHYKNKISKKELYALSNDRKKRRIYTLKGKEKRPITALFIEETPNEIGNWGSHTKYFEFELININKEEVIKFSERPMHK